MNGRIPYSASAGAPEADEIAGSVLGLVEPDGRAADRPGQVRRLCKSPRQCRDPGELCLHLRTEGAQIVVALHVEPQRRSISAQLP